MYSISIQVKAQAGGVTKYHNQHMLDENSGTFLGCQK